MAIVGAFARVDPQDVAATRQRLDALAGVSTFDLDRPEKVGILIEAADIDAAHAVLTGPVKQAAGVWGVWPVFVHSEADEEQVRQAVSKQA